MEDKQVYTGNSSKDRLNQGSNSRRGTILPLRSLLRLRPNPRTIRTNLRLVTLNLISRKQLRPSSRWLSSNHIRPRRNSNSNLSNIILNLTHPRNTHPRLRNNNSSSSNPGTITIFIIHLLNNCALTNGHGLKRMVRTQEEGTSSSRLLSLNSSLPRLRRGLLCMALGRIKVMDEEGHLGRWAVVEAVLVGTEVVWVEGEAVAEVVQ
jgi:hypothetical protein